MWQSATGILVAQHSPSLDLTDLQTLFETIVIFCMKQFTETSFEHYDRHHYRVWLPDDSCEDVKSYAQAQRVGLPARQAQR